MPPPKQRPLVSVETEPSLEELTRSLEQLQCLALICNKDREIIWANPQFCSLSGYTLNELIGQNPNLFKSSETPTELYQELWSSLNSSKAWRGYFVNLKKNGDKYIEECTINPIYTSGHQLHYLALYHNPLDRGKLLSNYNWSKYFARHILDQFPNPIWTCDLQGHRDYFNSKWNQSLGKRQELSHEEWEKSVHPEDLPLVRQAMQSGLIRQQSFELLYRLSISHEQYRWISEEIQPHYDQASNFSGFVGSCMDVTESKGLQDALLSNKARIEAKGNYKTEIVENLSRNALKINLDLLGQILELNPYQGQDELLGELQQIIDQAQNLRSTLYDLHEFARIEAHPPQLNYEQFNLSELLMEIDLECSDKAEERQLRFYADFYNSETPTSICLDRSFLKKLIKLLLENIMDLLEKGFLRLGYHVEHSHPLAKLHIYLEGWEDLGNESCTVDHRTHPRIAIAESMVTHLSGKILINRKDCDHLNYELVIPLGPKLSAPAGELAGTILIADDDDLFAMILEELLHAEGFKTKRATNGKEAVEIAFADQPIHLVLMDLQMPIMDGFEATKIIKKGKPKLNVVALTGQSLDECFQDFLDADFADYLAKPYQKANLLKILRHSSHKGESL